MKAGSLPAWMLAPTVLLGCGQTDTTPFTTADLVEHIVLDATEDFPCSLEIESTGVTLSSDIDGTIPDPNLPVSLGPDGRFYTSTFPGQGQVLVWSEEGAFMGTIGQPGEGPGEFLTWPQPVVDDQGIVNVFDFGRGGLHRFTPDGEFLSMATSSVFRWDVSVLAFVGMDSILSAMPRSARQFQVVDGAGNVLNAFGEPVADGEAQPQRHIAVTRGGTFWAAPGHGSRDGYVLEEWRIDGSLVRRFVRDVPWLPDVSAGPASSSSPLPTFQVYVGEHGHLVVLVGVSRPDADSGAPGEVWTEVIDPRVPEVLASRQSFYGGDRGDDTPEIYGIFPKSRLGVREITDELGPLHVIEIMRYNLVPGIDGRGGARDCS